MSSKEETESDLVAMDLEQARDGTVQPVPEEKNVKRTEFTIAAILNLIGSVSILFCSAGFTNAYGVFQEYYSQTLLSHKTPSEIAWIGSFDLFIMFAAALPVGYLNDLYGPRILVFIGSVIMLFALFMTSLCSQYYQLFLAQGLLLGVGIAFVFLPAFAILPRYFAVRRGVTLGITASGASIGGVVWPIALRNLFEKVGFGWGVRIATFMMLPFLATACVTIKLPKVARDLPKPKPDLSFMKEPLIFILGVGLFFNYLGLFTPIFYVTSYTVSLGLDPSMAFYMVAIINALSLFGRIIPGILGDRYGAFNIVILSAGTSGMVCMCWTKATSIPGIALWSAVYGFTSGAIISAQGACAAALLRPEQYGLGIGVLMAIWSIAALIGEPISGQLLDKYSYLGLSLFAGLALILSMVTLVIIRFKINPKMVAKV